MPRRSHAFFLLFGVGFLGFFRCRFFEHPKITRPDQTLPIMNVARRYQTLRSCPERTGAKRLLARVYWSLADRTSHTSVGPRPGRIVSGSIRIYQAYSSLPEPTRPCKPKGSRGPPLGFPWQEPPGGSPWKSLSGSPLGPIWGGRRNPCRVPSGMPRRSHAFSLLFGVDLLDVFRCRFFEPKITKPDQTVPIITERRQALPDPTGLSR